MTAGTETRLLLLGALALFEPVNAYQVRRELLSWDIEDWAHINPGSIYSGLGTLTRQGHVERHDLADGGRSVAVYRLSDSGRAEFDRLYREAIETVDVTSSLRFNTAFALLMLVRREDFVGMLDQRLENLDEAARRYRRLSDDLATTREAPPHVTWNADLWSRMLDLELRWARDLKAAIEAGGLQFAGEPMTWQPAEDDPGWQMADDRERYQQLLGLRNR